VCFTVDR